MKLAMVRLYCGESGQKGFYNMQELGLAKAFIKMGIEVYIITLSDKVQKVIQIKDESGAILLTIPAKSITNHGFFKCSILLELKIDIVHLQSDNQMFAPYVMHYCKRNGIKCYNYVGTLYSDSNNRLKRLLMGTFTRRNINCFKSSLVFAKTPTVQRQLINIGVENAQMAPVGLDVGIIPEIQESKYELRKKLDIPQDKKVLIFVGRLEEYKKPLSAIDLIGELDKNFYLILIGKGTLKEEVHKKIELLKVKDKIRYIEEVPNKEIHKYYKASDFFINLNEREIFGMSILEAMYQGCTVVANRAPGPSYIIEDNISGYLVDNISEMKERLRNAECQINNSKNRILSSFSWDITAKEIINSLKII